MTGVLFLLIVASIKKKILKKLIIKVQLKFKIMNR